MRSFEQIRAALSDRQALICTLAGEASGEPLNGQVAVACSIRNRAQRPRWWGDSIASVCLCRWQYSCWWETATRNTQAVYTLAECLLDGRASIGTVAYSSDLIHTLGQIADAVIDGTIADTTNNATHYMTTALFASPQAPKWSKGLTPSAVIGHHAFFRGVA